MILFNEPPYLGKEDSYIVDAIKNEKHISGSGKYSKLCHEFLQKLTGSPKVLLTTSGTDALEWQPLNEMKSSIIKAPFLQLSTASLMALGKSSGFSTFVTPRLPHESVGLTITGQSK